MASPPACAIQVEAAPSVLDSLLIPFRSQPQPPALPEGYSLASDARLPLEELDRLLVLCGDPSRPLERLQRALERSAWQLLSLIHI